MCIVTWWINNHKTTVQCCKLGFTHLNSPSTKLLDFLQNVLKKFRYLGIFYFEKYSSFFMPLFPRLMDEHAAGSRLQLTWSAATENRVGRNAKDWWKKSRFLTASHYDSFKPCNFYISECYSRPFTRSSLRRRWWDAASCWPSSPTCGTPGTGSTLLW